MTRKSIISFIIILLGILTLTSFQRPELMPSDVSGHKTEINGINIIELRGNWHQMGRQYGLLAKEQIADILDYLDREIGTNPSKIDSAYSVAEKLYSLYPDYLKEFFEGIVQTTGLSMVRIQLCNAAEYIEPLFNCSAIAVWGDFAEGKLVFGRNYDAHSFSEIFKDLTVTIYHPDGEKTAATIGYAGEIYCVNGINEKGIFIELNNGMPSAGETIHWDVRPSTTSLFELLFEAEDMEDVDKFFTTQQSFASFTIGVANKDEARSYEWCYDGVKRGDIVTEDGLMISTNHYVNPDWQYAVPTDKGSWNSITRRNNLSEQAVNYKGVIDVTKMEEIICTTIENGGPMHDLTRYQIVVVPEDFLIYINNPNQGWVSIDMNDYFNN